MFFLLKATSENPGALTNRVTSRLSRVSDGLRHSLGKLTRIDLFGFPPVGNALRSPNIAQDSKAGTMNVRQRWFISWLVIASLYFWTQSIQAQSGPGEISPSDSPSGSPAVSDPRAHVDGVASALGARPIGWYRAAAAKGSVEAQFLLGWFYDHGNGVRRDYRQAAAYYRAAAERGYSAAEDNLGTLYESGRGVHKNLSEAARWYRAAAEQGNAAAQCNLASLFFFGRGVQRDYAQAVRWLRAAAEQDYAYGELLLSSSYYHGYGVEVDFSQAAK